MMEPSFFYGAMYVNYALTVALCIIIFILAKVVIDLSLLQSFVAIIIVLFLMAPVNLRLSRIIWINFFVSYDSSHLKVNQKND